MSPDYTVTYVSRPYPLNTNLSLVGGTWTHAFLTAGDPLVNFIAYAGDDRQRGEDPTVGRHLYGAKAGGEYKLLDNTKLFASVAVQQSTYGGTNSFFLVSRKDTRYDLNIGISHKLSREWSVRPEIFYTRNDSNIGFSDFDRKQILVTVRRDFL